MQDISKHKLLSVALRSVYITEHNLPIAYEPGSRIVARDLAEDVRLLKTSGTAAEMLGEAFMSFQDLKELEIGDGESTYVKLGPSSNT